MTYSSPIFNADISPWKGVKAHTSHQGIDKKKRTHVFFFLKKKNEEEEDKC